MPRRRTPSAPVPPAGTYDPALDAQQAAAQRGYQDLLADMRIQSTRAATDYGLGREDIERERGYGIEDLETGRSRTFEDYDTQFARGHAGLDLQLGRGTEDYQRNVGLLQRSYQQKARRQAEGARQAGVTSGGIALLSAAKRRENEAIERQPLDIGQRRLGEDVGRSKGYLTEDVLRGQTRAHQDYLRGVTRTQAGADTALGRLALGYGRGGEDLAIQQSRAGRELGAYGLDTAAQRYYQAAGAGWQPEFMDPRRRR